MNKKPKLSEESKVKLQENYFTTTRKYILNILTWIWLILIS